MQRLKSVYFPRLLTGYLASWFRGFYVSGFNFRWFLGNSAKASSTDQHIDSVRINNVFHLCCYRKKLISTIVWISVKFLCFTYNILVWLCSMSESLWMKFYSVACKVGVYWILTSSVQFVYSSLLLHWMGIFLICVW